MSSSWIEFFMVCGNFFSAKKIPSRYYFQLFFLPPLKWCWYDLLLELGGNKTNCPLCTYQIGRCLLTFFFQSARQSLDRSNNSELLRHFYIIFISKKMSKTKIFFDLKKKFDITDIHYMKTVVRLEIMSHGNNFEWLVKKCWLGCISLKQRT